MVQNICDYLYRNCYIYNSYIIHSLSISLISYIVAIELPYVYGDGSLTTHRYFLLCKVCNVDYKGLLTAIGNKDLGVEPKVREEVFFINIENHVIFHLYDDCGLDIIAKEKQVLRDLYLRYNEWILDYDRRRIDLIFDS